MSAYEDDGNIKTKNSYKNIKYKININFSLLTMKKTKSQFILKFLYLIFYFILTNTQPSNS